MCTELSEHPEELIWQRAAAQHGVVTRAQLRSAGLSDSQVSYRVRTKRLHRIHRGVYAVGHRRLALEGRRMAALLACGQNAVMSHRTAGDAWDIRRSASGRIDVTVPARARRLPPPPVTLHRSDLRHGAETTTCGGIPVTTPARTLLDLAAVLPRSSLERAMERAETLRLFDLTSVQAVLLAHPRRAGSRALAAILESWSPAALTRSELEERFLVLCARAAIPRPLVNVRVGPYEVDFLWRRERVVVETDGHAHHGTRAAFERDRARDAALQAAGYRVIRFTYRQVTREPGVVARVLRSVLSDGRRG